MPTIELMADIEILKAQVARLEGELADERHNKAAVVDAAKEIEQQRDAALGEKEVMAAALRGEIQKCPLCRGKKTVPDGVGTSGRLPCPCCRNMRAALSGESEVWEQDGAWQEKVADYFERHGKKALRENERLRRVTRAAMRGE